MRGALFGDQVEGYKEAFVYKGEYEIANAPIKPVEEQFKSSSSELDYQMSFGRQTVIQPINTEANPVLPEYQTISSIPKTCDPSEKFDILGVVLYVEEEARTISTAQGRDNLVREIVITDHRALRHRDTLADRQARVLDVRNTSKERQVMTICALKEKKVVNTLQDERQFLRVVVPEPSFEKLHAYLGCSNCNKRTDVPAGETHTCLNCGQKNVISIPRVTFNCDVSDGNATLPVTIFSKDLEKLFKLPVEDIFRMRHSDDLETFSAIQKLLQVSFLIEVGPKTTLSLNNVLQWILKRVVAEDEVDEVNLKPKAITQLMDYHTVKPDEPNPKQKLPGKSADQNTEGPKNPTHEAAHVFVDEDVLGSTN
ncbi:uncharacterized protein LOC104892916 isoform X2 [Beta vulgaris subsp. vulgaris]|nr:uncharacterized protein LOC104892916 isoform X2 [Beta vulgaris subsp. vulgaris]